MVNVINICRFSDVLKARKLLFGNFQIIKSFGCLYKSYKFCLMSTLPESDFQNPLTGSTVMTIKFVRERTRQERVS